MKINFNIKRTFKINGREYGSVEEMPPETRAVFEKGSALATGGDRTTGTKARIVFNGVEYENVDEMPTYARNLYDQAMKAAHAAPKPVAGENRGHAAGPRPAAAEPAFPARSILTGIVIAVLGYLAYVILRG